MKSLIIGLGSIAQKHIKALNKINSNVEIAAIRSSQDAPSKEGVKNLYTFEEAKDFAPDHILICNPSSEHMSTIHKALTLNSPLFIEKPALTTLEGSTSLLEEVQKTDVQTYVACNLRFLESLVFVKKYLKGKNIQEVTAYCGSYLPEWRPDQDYKSSYSADATMGGGVHLDLIHELDYLYWLFGEPQSKKVTLSSKSSLKINAVDSAHYSLEFTNHSAYVTLNYFRKDPRRTLEIVLENESLIVNLIENTVYSFKDKSFIFKSDQKIVDTYEPQLRSFLADIKNNSSSYSLEEHLKVLEICLHEQS